MAKRGNNEGTIYKSSDGRWRAALSLPDGTRKYLSGRTRDDVRRQLIRKQNELERGALITDERQTVGQFLDRWLEDVIRPTRKPRTYEFYEAKVRGYINPVIGAVRLSKLTPQHVQKLLADMSERGLSPQTVTHARRVLSTALAQAVKWGLVSRNAATHTDAPRVPQFESRQLSRQEMTTLLAAVSGDRLEALYLLALGLGLRKAELLGLCWDDVDLDGGKLRVANTLQYVRGEGLSLIAPKTKRSQRTLPLSQEMVTALRRHRVRQDQLELVAGSRWKGWPGGDLVFTSTIGTPIEQGSLTRHFKRVLEKAGLPEIRFHDLRGTFGTLMASLGVPPRTLMELMGHSQISTTMEIYAKAVPEDKQAAIEAMQSLISGSGE